MLTLRHALFSLLLLSIAVQTACQSPNDKTETNTSQTVTQTLSRPQYQVPKITVDQKDLSPDALAATSDPSDLTASTPTDAVNTPPLMVATEGGVDEEDEEPCLIAHSAARPFLPQAAEPPLNRILPATDNECGFYNWSLQAFLHTTQPDANGRPAFLNYTPVEHVFDMPLYAGTKPAPAPHKPLLLNAGFRQAGEAQGILVDNQRNPVFYSIHINAHFADFVRREKLNQVASLLKAPGLGGIPADLEFPSGAIELKAAWGIVESGSKQDSYFTMPARVPLLKMDGDKVVATAETREVTVALLGLHVVGVVEDHPEFIWATFEHVNAQRQRDLAPSAQQNPAEGPLVLDDILSGYPLFQVGTAVGEANRLPSLQRLQPGSQKFTQSTPVFRVFPASLSVQSEEDEELITLNEDFHALFERTGAPASDFRRHYPMVGAVWIDEPDSNLPNGVFKADRTFDNLPGQTLLAGEDALSNLALESFTQHTRPNCFSCHNTLMKVLNTGHTLPPRRVNVSNVLTFFAERVLESKNKSE